MHLSFSNPVHPSIHLTFSHPVRPSTSISVFAQTTEIEVRIRETHDDAGVVGLHGIVRSVSGSLCSVFVRDEDKTVSYK